MVSHLFIYVPYIDPQFAHQYVIHSRNKASITMTLLGNSLIRCSRSSISLEMFEVTCALHDILLPLMMPRNLWRGGNRDCDTNKNNHTFVNICNSFLYVKNTWKLYYSVFIYVLFDSIQ